VPSQACAQAAGRSVQLRAPCVCTGWPALGAVHAPASTCKRGRPGPGPCSNQLEGPQVRPIGSRRACQERLGCKVRRQGAADGLWVLGVLSSNWSMRPCQLGLLTSPRLARQVVCSWARSGPWPRRACSSACTARGEPCIFSWPGARNQGVGRVLDREAAAGLGLACAHSMRGHCRLKESGASAWAKPPCHWACSWAGPLALKALSGAPQPGRPCSQVWLRAASCICTSKRPWPFRGARLPWAVACMPGSCSVMRP
jgi:hypothetical protein